jgi:GH18 family chitinase
VRAFDYFDAMARATSTGAVVTRNNADEMTFTFASSTYIQEPPILTFTEPSAQPAVLMHPNPNASTTFFVSFPDAQSEMDKVALANKYGLRGIMFFKADGQMDPALWNLLP